MAFTNSPQKPDRIRCLRFANIAPGKPYHAALSATEGASARGYRITEHTHDFYEMICVLAGEATHGRNGNTATLRAGDLIFLRPGDGHFIRFQTGRLLHYINIALDAEMWRAFHTIADLPPDTNAPITLSLLGSSGGDAAFAECAGAFQRSLEHFQGTGQTNSVLRTEACRLLATIAPHLFASEHDNPSRDPLLPESAPPWLLSACRTLQRDPDALRVGLPAFVADAGVTRTHLARVLKAATHLTPTEYVNGLRLERAARLLATTTLSILDVAGECGFEQPAYFYRLFRVRYGTSPHAYRTAAARRVAPPPLLSRDQA